MPTPTADTYTAASGATLQGGRGVPVGPVSTAPYQVAPDGVWTWFSDDRAIYRNGATYFNAVTKAGKSITYKHNHDAGTTESKIVSTVTEIDDHDNGALLFRPDGKIVTLFGWHVESLIRVGVATAPESITNFGLERRLVTGSQLSYANPHYLSVDPANLRVFCRRMVATDATVKGIYMMKGPLPVESVHMDYASQVQVWQGSAFGTVEIKPYAKFASNGLDEVHVFVTSSHPTHNSQNSLYHFSIRTDSTGVDRYYRSNGVEITDALPVTSASASQVYDGTTARCWIGDAAIGLDGLPRAIFMRYPGVVGAACEYWVANWSGTAWASVKLADAGAAFIPGEPHYHPGICFDSQNANRIYASLWVGGVLQIQEFRSADNGATWVLHRDITSGGTSAVRRMRPYSPRNHDGRAAVLWFEGRYDMWNNYDTAIMASAAVA